MDWKAPFLEPPMKREAFNPPKKRILKGYCYTHEDRHNILIFISLGVYEKNVIFDGKRIW